ncbi:hypothetical protein TrRE_jg13524 [Triparma retinervis]|uniref:peptidylprolyl isomerase n=1 Tax=Triparma retinervis TaxID=2557542 RepID=A0A9W6ZYB3_9STRA|nr:hypothetical protein TrRE_jg13524 [Triparma retinervis]
MRCRMYARFVIRSSYPTYRTTSGVDYIDFLVGPGPPIRPGLFAHVRYTASITISPSPTQIVYDKVLGSGTMVKFGSGRWIRGLDEGMVGMREGGRRRIIIPPKLGYALGGGPVPKGARER